MGEVADFVLPSKTVFPRNARLFCTKIIQTCIICNPHIADTSHKASEYLRTHTETWEHRPQLMHGQEIGPVPWFSSIPPFAPPFHERKQDGGIGSTHSFQIFQPVESNGHPNCPCNLKISKQIVNADKKQRRFRRSWSYRRCCPNRGTTCRCNAHCYQ